MNVITVPFFRFDDSDIIAVRAISDWWPDVADATEGRIVIDIVLADVAPLLRKQVETLRDYCKAAVSFYNDFSSSMAVEPSGESSDQPLPMDPDTWALVVENWELHAIPAHQAVIDLCNRGLLLN